METKINNRVAVVTGGGSGLGRAMALGLARAGGKVLIAEVREPEGNKAQVAAQTGLCRHKLLWTTAIPVDRRKL